MSPRFTVALGQVRPRLGDVAANVEIHLQWIERARQRGAALVVFPELGLTGYQVQDLTLDVARRLSDPEIQRLVAASAEIDVVFSFVEESADHRFYVAAAYASRGELLTVHRKVYLPTYGMFDEGRYFAAGERFRTFETRFGQAGLAICEDAWHLSSPYLLTLAGAGLMILPASAPARSVTDEEHFGSQSFWHDLLRVYAQLLGVNIVFVNRVGFEDGVSFFGGSGIVSADGEWRTEAATLDEELCLGEVDPDAVRRARFIAPVLRDEKPHLVAAELARIAQQAGAWKP